MPTYEYECGKCSHHFEAFHSIVAPPLRKCPKCGGRVKRLPGAGSGVLFKGGGFYQTDYRSDSYKSAAKADCAPAPAAADSSTKKTAAKSDTPAKSGAAASSKGGKAS
jgi:putative FmdB family regulatory protein